MKTKPFTFVNPTQKELSSDVFEDEYLDDYVKAIFRLDKLREKCNNYVQIPVSSSNDNYRKKVAPSFPGPLMPTRTDS